MIDLLFEFLILKSIGVAILLLLIVAVRPLVLKHLNARVAYNLWLMIPLYLLMPVHTAEINSSGGIMTFIRGTDVLSSGHIGNQRFAGELVALWSLTIWASGCLMILAIFAVRYKSLKKSLNDINAAVNSQQYKVRSNKNIRFVSSSLIGSPAVFGLFQSYLILPEDFFNLPAKNQQMILQHEFYHINRNDHRFNFLRVFMKSLFWFNPMFYWADKYCEADQEMSCDLGVLQNSNTEERKIYANALLQSVTGEKRNKLISQWKYQSLIKERVKMLKNNQVKKWHSLLAAIFASFAILGTSSVVMAEKDELTDSGAIPISIVQPRYPRTAAEEGTEGWVKLRFNIDSKGFPYEVAVIDDMPKGVFVSDAVKAVRQWQFKTKGGQKNLIYTMEFVLEAPEVVEN